MQSCTNCANIMESSEGGLISSPNLSLLAASLTLPLFGREARAGKRKRGSRGCKWGSNTCNLSPGKRRGVAGSCSHQYPIGTFPALPIRPSLLTNHPCQTLQPPNPPSPFHPPGDRLRLRLPGRQNFTQPWDRRRGVTNHDHTQPARFIQNRRKQSVLSPKEIGNWDV